MIDNNKNTQISDPDEDPTMELEPLSEEACAEFKLSDDSADDTDSVPEIKETQEIRVEAEAPISGENASAIQELREEVKFRVEMNGILQLGIDQLRERCDGLAEQVSSLQKTSDTFNYELELSRRQVTKTKRKLAKARDNEHALLINLKKLGKADAANAVIAEQDGVIEELRKDNSELADTVSDLEAKLELATRHTDDLETRMREANAGNAKLSAELTSRNAEIDDYKSQLAALRGTSKTAEQSSSDRAPGARSVSGSHAEDRWMLVGLDANVTDTYIVGDGIVTIGSSPDSDIHIQSKFISRHHAQLIQTHNGCVLGDLNSTNGTFINSRRINKRILRTGDLVTIGKHRFRYEKQSLKSTATDMRDSEYSFNSRGN